MGDEFYIGLLSDVSNLSLGTFGISIGVFTVLYAFILSRIDSLTEISEKIKSGKATPNQMQKERFYVSDANRWKRFNDHLERLTLTSFILYILSMFTRYEALVCNLKGEYLKYISIVMGALSFFLLMYIGVMLILVLKNYKKLVAM